MDCGLYRGTPTASLGGPFDCILCADVVYEKECVRPLMQSLLALAHRKTVIYMANERRSPAVYDEFFWHMKEYFHWHEIDRSELEAGYIKDAIQVFELRVKKRKVPAEMRIQEAKDDDRAPNPNEDEYHPLHKSKVGADNAARTQEDPYQRDLWRDLLE